MTDFDSFDGTRLAYRTMGDGPLLVCLPGGPGRASAYLGNLAGLEVTNTLLLLDSRGTGESGFPDDDTTYAAEGLARDVEALREHLGVDQLRLLGHSAGGKVAQVWAAANPSRVERLVLVTTYLGSEGMESARELIRASRSGEPWFAQAQDAAEGMAYARAAERQRLERMMRPFMYGAWGEREQQHAATADGQSNPRASSRFQTLATPDELRQGLAAVTAPVLVVTAERDAVTPPVAGQQVAACFPNVRLVELSGAGHFPWVDAPEAFSATVGNFLAE